MSRDSQIAVLLALIVAGRWAQLKRELRKAAQSGIPLTEIREICLQSHLFAGFPRAIEAFETLAAVEATGVFPKDHHRASSESAAAPSAGGELFQKIYGAKSEEVLRRLGSFHPKLREWISTHAYATVLSRPELSPKQRELAAVAALVVSRQWRQLLSHLRGALRCGAAREEISALLQDLKGIAPAPTIQKARRLFEQA